MNDDDDDDDNSNDNESNNNNICELSYLWSKMNLGLFLLVIFRGAFADKKNELCAKIVHGFQPLTIFGKSSILDV